MTRVADIKDGSQSQLPMAVILVYRNVTKTAGYLPKRGTINEFHKHARYNLYIFNHLDRINERSGRLCPCYTNN